MLSSTENLGFFSEGTSWMTNEQSERKTDQSDYVMKSESSRPT